MKRQSAAPENEGISPELLARYCLCFSNGVLAELRADNLPQITSEAAMIASFGQHNINRIAEGCQQKIAQPLKN